MPELRADDRIGFSGKWYSRYFNDPPVGSGDYWYDCDIKHHNRLQRWFERLPAGLTAAKNRDKILKALDALVAEYQDKQGFERMGGPNPENRAELSNIRPVRRTYGKGNL